MPTNRSEKTAAGLVGAYIVLSWVCAVVAVLADRTTPSQANLETAIHGVILAAVSVITLIFAIGLLRHRPGAARRVILICVIVVVALIVTAMVLPLPAWMVVTHMVGAVLLAVAAAILLRQARGTRDGSNPVKDDLQALGV